MPLSNTPMRETYEMYIKRLFERALAENLDRESCVLGKNAKQLRHQTGGKNLGVKLLEQLLADFEHPTIGIPSSLVIPADYLGDHIELPADFVKEDMDTDHVIFRSNASFEYGSLPGFLISVGMVPIASVWSAPFKLDK